MSSPPRARRRLSPFALAALAALALTASASLTACHSKPSPPPAPTASASASSRADLFAHQDDLDLPPGLSRDLNAAGTDGGATPAAEPAHPIEVALKDAGAEPRTPLTYDLAVGKPQIVTLTVKEEGGPSGAGDVPPLRLTLSVVAAGKPSPDLTLVQAHVTKLEIAPDAKGVPPEAAAQIGEASKGLEAIGATFAVSNRGIIEDAELSGDPESRAAVSNLVSLIEDALALSFAPLPAEPVGIGAAWTVPGPAAPGMPRGAGDKTYVLKARTPMTATLQEEQQAQAPEQPIGDPEAPPGTTIAIASKETSTLSLRLDGVASKAASDEDSSMTTRDPTSSPPKVAVMKMKRSLRLESR